MDYGDRKRRKKTRSGKWKDGGRGEVQRKETVCVQVCVPAGAFLIV